MIDSGASYCFLSAATATHAGLTPQPAKPMTVILADGTSILSSQSCLFCMYVTATVVLSVDACIVDKLSHDLVLGIDWLRKYNPAIDWATYSVAFPQFTPAPIACLPTQPVAKISTCSLASISNAITHGATAWLALLRTSTGAGDLITPSRWDTLCNEYQDIFEEPGTPPPRQVKHHIDLHPGARPPAQRTYRMSPTKLAEVRR